MAFSFASAVSTLARSAEAAEAVASEVIGALGGRKPDLAVVFITPHHAAEMEEVVSGMAARLGARAFLGCTGQGVIGLGREVEEGPGISLLAASLPGVAIDACHVEAEATPEGLAFSGLPELPEATSGLLLFGDPYSFPVVEFLDRMEDDRRDLVVMGGLSSGAFGPGESRLFVNGETVADGAAAAVLSGPVRIRPVVSQGCKPFGKPAVVTRAEDNVVLELGGRPAIERLNQDLEALGPQERQLLRNGLHLGRAIDPTRQSFRRGDFLIRNVIGVDRKAGSIAMTDQVKAGQTIQFHLRDARSASEDLELLLREARIGPAPVGALLVSCNGRGSYLFTESGHDAGAVRRELGPVPLAGFFAAGELGPVGGRNFLHGFTASIALFEEASP
jgi:small ligand-binding sensory domain FIST